MGAAEAAPASLANEDRVRRYWTLFDRGDFTSAGELMAPDALIVWPNTREVFHGRDAFVRTNLIYPGRWRVTLERLYSFADTVITVALVRSVDGRESHYACSIFEFHSGSVSRLTEYWGENSDPPAWRTTAGLSERY
jgi:ketosteroid isomerase-like protein